MLKVIQRLVQHNYVVTKKHVESNRLFLQANLFQHACATPIMCLQLGFESLLQNAIDQSVKEKVMLLQQAAQRLQLLIKHLGADHPERTQFCPVSALQQCKELISGSVSLITLAVDSTLSSRSIQLYGSCLLFQEGLLCLIQNAVLASQRNHASQILITIGLHKQQCRIDIIDFGRGDDRLAATLEHRLRRVPTEQHGCGLWLAYAIMSDHFGGTILIQSKRELGTRITVLVPSQIPDYSET